eukprot:c8015_g1_i1.p1 GENE.c8015_g1_i1~~c8015_g1_i1.p1  ORF type:complete len:429 (-),score=99.50 c8015_g1_i1:83-1318(-)
MCGRRSAAVTGGRIRTLFGLAPNASPDLNIWNPRFNIAPMTASPILFVNPPATTSSTTSTGAGAGPSSSTAGVIGVATTTTSHAIPAQPANPTAAAMPSLGDDEDKFDESAFEENLAELKYEGTDPEIKMEELEPLPDDDNSTRKDPDSADDTNLKDAPQTDPKLDVNNPEDERDSVVVKTLHTQARFMKWGLVPCHSKTGTPPGSTINARSEGVFTSPLYSRLLTKRRCIVVSDGYYEWKMEEHQGEMRKQPYLITLPQGRVLLMPGLFDIWRDKEGKEVYTYTIITTEPTEEISFIHDRMPHVLTFEQAAKWLDIENYGPTKQPEEFRALLKPTTMKFIYHRVSPAVGNVRAQGVDLIKPYDPEKVPSKATGGMKVGAFHKFLKAPPTKRSAEPSNDEKAPKKSKPEAK